MVDSNAPRGRDNGAPSDQPERRAGAETMEAKRSAQRAAAESQETLQRAGEAARQGLDEVTANLAEQTRQTTSSLKDAMEVHRGTVQTATEDIKAAAVAASASAEGLLTIESTLVDWAGQSVQSIARVSQRVLGSRNPRELAEAQREFAETLMKNWLEGTATILRASQELAGRALGPVTERVEQRAAA